jgi:ADP-ribose pyrophosphatase YjhB (NUDIX family)
VCGYISYDETIKEASSRETKEETGLNIPPNAWRLVNVNSNPKSDIRQNITFRMIVEWKPEYGTEFTTEFSEPDEVDEIRWISLEEVDKLDWAFSHKELVNKYLKEKIKS